MNFKRPDFQRMMQDLRTGKINGVIVKDVSRLGRHFVMTSEYVEKIFPTMGIRLICVNDDYDSADENSDTSSLLMPFKMVMNDSYAKDISKKIRSSISAKMNSGEYLPSASSIPYGYIRNSEQNTYDVDKEAAPNVVRIFEMRADGMALNAICKKLNEESVPCPGKLRYMRGITNAEKYKNALWIHGTLRKILMDQVYIGNRVHGKLKRERIGMDKTKRAENEWTIIENAHEPIITMELFNKVQDALQETNTKRQAYRKQDAPEVDNRDILRGKVYCGDCGSMMRALKGMGRADEHGMRKSYLYYECGKYLDSGRAVCCKHYVRQETIMDTLHNALNQQLQVAIDFEILLDEVQMMPKVVRYNSEVTEKLTSIKTKRRNMEQRMEQLIIDLTDGLIDNNEYLYAKSRYNKELENLLEKENRMLADSKKLDGIVGGSDKWIQTLKGYQKFPVIDRKMVEYLVKKILIYPDSRIKIILNYQDPYSEVMEYVKFIPEVLADVG
jgi:DNA invertase Pin-like site-specific DNA recombinase